MELCSTLLCSQLLQDTQPAAPPTKPAVSRGLCDAERNTTSLWRLLERLVTAVLRWQDTSPQVLVSAKPFVSFTSQFRPFNLFSLQSPAFLQMCPSTTTWVLPGWCGTQREVLRRTLFRLWVTETWQSPVTPATHTAPWLLCSAATPTASLWWHKAWHATTLWALHPTASWQVCQSIRSDAQVVFPEWAFKCDPFLFIQSRVHLLMFKPACHADSLLQLHPGSRVTSLWVMLPTLTTKMATTPPVWAQTPPVWSQGWCVVQCTVSGSRH